MAQGGYGKFFKAARDIKKGTASTQAKSTTLRGRKVSDVLSSLKSRPRTRKNPPVLPIFSAVALLIGSVYAYNNLEALEKLVSRIEIHALGMVQAKESKSTSVTPGETSAETKGDAKEKSSSGKSPAPTSTKLASKDWTPEQLAFFNKLEERKVQLDTKEKELQKMEEELQEQKLALEKRLKELVDIRTKISSRLDEKVKIDQEKVDKLVEFYSNMKPQNAAKVFEDIDEDLAVEILNKMKKKNAADIMNLLKSDKAQKLSEKFAGYKRQ